MMELTFATDAQVGFLEEDSPHLELDPLEPGQKALYITSQDFEGITVIGTLGELRQFSSKMASRLETLSTIARMRAALKLLDNEHITPQGRRILRNILDDEEGKL